MSGYPQRLENGRSPNVRNAWKAVVEQEKRDWLPGRACRRTTERAGVCANCAIYAFMASQRLATTRTGSFGFVRTRRPG
jgi:hypothetical protein